MRVTLVAPFLLGRDLDLAAVLRTGVQPFCEGLERALPDGWTLAPLPVAGTGALLDAHISHGARQLPRALLAATAVLPVAGLPARVTVGEVGLTVSPLGVACLVVPVTLPRAEVLPAVEMALLLALKDAVRAIARDLAAALPDDCLATPTAGTLPAGTTLWFHRVLTEGRSATFDRETAYGRTVPLAGGGEVVVADGYSRIAGGSAEDRDAALGALRLATERWLALDAENRRLADGLTRLRTRDGSRAEAYREALRLSEAASLTTLVLAEQWRYVVNVELATLRALGEVWQVDAEVDDVNAQVAVLRDLADRYVVEERGRLERMRTALAYAFTLVSTLVGMVVLYDFVADAGRHRDGTARRAVGLAVAAVAVAALVTIFVREYRRDRG